MRSTHLTAFDYVRLRDEAPMDRMRRVEAGITVRQLIDLSASMAVSREKLCGWIGISSALARHGTRGNALLSLAEGERTLAMARVVGLVVKIVSESGDLEGFDAAKWTARWLDRPNAALGGRYPGELMDTADGRQLVESLIAKMQSCAYS